MGRGISEGGGQHEGVHALALELLYRPRAPRNTFPEMITSVHSGKCGPMPPRLERQDGHHRRAARQCCLHARQGLVAEHHRQISRSFLRSVLSRSFRGGDPDEKKTRCGTLWAGLACEAEQFGLQCLARRGILAALTTTGFSGSPLASARPNYAAFEHCRMLARTLHLEQADADAAALDHVVTRACNTNSPQDRAGRGRR